MNSNVSTKTLMEKVTQERQVQIMNNIKRILTKWGGKV
jgi:hypothetical protein